MALVLLIDEDSDFSALVERVIRRQGHRVANFASTERALEWVKENNPDLAIISAGKHGERAKELLPKLDSAGLKASSLILSTGISSASEVKRLFSDRVRMVLPKGSDLEEVERLVNSALSD